MSIAPTDTALRRSWTNEDTLPTGNRFGIMLALALAIVGLTSFVVYRLFRSNAKTCAVTISITDYGQRFSKPKYGIWLSDEFGQFAANIGSTEWTFNKQIEFTGLQNTGNIKDKLAGLPSLLVNNNLQAKDTVIVQLRCHAAVTKSDDPKATDETWECGLIVGENPLKLTLPFREFFNDLQAVPARNIILLADICDLKSVPGHGLFVNPIATYLLKACAATKPNAINPEQNVWVVCSASDYQTSHLSIAKQKTLFQEACEHALEQVEKGDVYLANFYDDVFQYCNVATHGKQTPLLIRAGDKDLAGNGLLCKPSNVSTWKLAQKSIVSRKGSKKTSPKPSVAVANSNSESNPFLGIEPALTLRSMKKHFISMQSRPEDLASDTSTKLTEPSVKTAPIETNPLLRIWQLRDELSSRKFASWSPSDFAPLQWRKYQSDVNLLSSYTERIKELEVIENAMTDNRPAESDGNLPKAWNHFLENETNRFFWQNDEELPAQEQLQWPPILDKYRKYSTLCNEFIFWRDWALEQLEIRDTKDEERGEIKNQCLALARELKKVQSYLAMETKEFAVAKSKQLNLNEVEKAHGELRKLLASRIKHLKENWDNHELTWLHERELQNLLNSPLLSLDQRKGLPELNSVAKHQKPSDAKRGDVSSVSTDGYWRNFRAEWSELIQSTVELIPTFQLNPVGLVVDSPEKMLEWGREYVRQQENFTSNPSTSPMKRWHSLSFRELGIEDDIDVTKSYSGIVASPTDATGIRLSFSSPERPGIEGIDFRTREKSTTLHLNIMQANHAAISKCKIEWKSDSESLKELRVSTMMNGRSVPLERNQKTEVHPENMRLELRFELPSPSPVDKSSFLNIIASKEDGKSVDQRIGVTTNSEQIGLDVKQIGSNGKPIEIDDRPLGPIVRYNSELPIYDFEFPAINDAVCSYRFMLVNKIKVERFAKLRILTSTNGESSPSRVIAESGNVSLLKHDSKELRFEPNSDEMKAVDFNIATDRIYFEIAECDMDGIRLPKKTTLLEAVFSPKNPKRYIDIEWEELVPSRRLDCKFQSHSLRRLWDVSSLAEVPIDIEHTRLDLLSGTDKQPISSMRISKVLKPNETVKFDGPVAIPNSALRFDFSIGGYARAITFQADVGRKLTEEIAITRAQFKNAVPLIENKISPENCVVRTEDTCYFKNFLSTGEKIAYQGMQFQCELDLGHHSSADLLIYQGDDLQISERILRDRTCTTRLAVSKEGLLDAKFQIGELSLTENHFFKNPSLNGEYKVVLQNGDQRDTLKIVFDQDKPESGVIELDRTGKRTQNLSGTPTLYQNSFISAVLLAKDMLSGIDRVEIGISKIQSPKAAFTGKDESVLKSVKPHPNDKNDEFRFDLEGSEFMDGFGQGDYWIVARTYDRAGNHQDANTPFKIHWTKKKSP